MSVTPPKVTAADRRCGDHRPGLGREWCHMDGEWCYQDDPCRGCTIVVLQARVAALEAALRTIERWNDFPPTGQQWEQSGNPISYGAAYGSNGERDYMRGIARKALAPGAGGTNG